MTKQHRKAISMSLKKRWAQKKSAPVTTPAEEIGKYVYVRIGNRLYKCKPIHIQVYSPIDK